MTVKDLCNGKKFQNLNFTLHKGEIVGLAGFVGAGRTEVLTSIFGADKLDSGEIYIKGEKVSIRSPKEANRPPNQHDSGKQTGRWSDHQYVDQGECPVVCDRQDF